MIQSEHIILRAPELTDLDILFNLENDTKLWYLSNTLTPVSRFALEQYILNAHEDIYTAKQLRLMIDLPDKTTIGCVDLFEFDPFHLRAGIGIILLETYQQRGLAILVLNLIKKYAFETLQLKQLWCSITEDNVASKSLFTNAEFLACGIRKAWVRKQNKWLDEHLFQYINTSL